MIHLALIAFLFLAAFACLIFFVGNEIHEAERTGVLPQLGKNRWLHKPILRSADPQAFEDGVRWLRAVPWIAASVTALGILLIGTLL